ncbi:fimbrial protein, partial [Pseudomonas aeruginosa]
MSMRLFPGRVSLRRRPGAQARQALVLGLCCLTGGQAWALNEVALNCSFDNGKGLPWRVVNELTSGTAKGTVLFARPVSLFLNYKPQASQEAHELVIGGNWSGVGYPGPYGTVASDIKGIGYRISVDAQDGVKRVIPVDNQPHALDKRVTSFSGSTTSDYLQELVLTVDPGELPAGDLKVTSVSGSATLNLWAVDRLKGEASIGSVLAVPADNYPTGVCRKPYSLIGPASIGIGGGAPPPPRPQKMNGGGGGGIKRQKGWGGVLDIPRGNPPPPGGCV